MKDCRAEPHVQLCSAARCWGWLSSCTVNVTAIYWGPTMCGASSVALTKNENKTQTLPSSLPLIEWQMKKYSQLMKANEWWSHRHWRMGRKLGEEKPAFRLHAGTPVSPELCPKIPLTQHFQLFFFPAKPLRLIIRGCMQTRLFVLKLGNLDTKNW